MAIKSEDKYVYMFSEGHNLSEMTKLNLSDITKLNLPFPQGFILTSSVCLNYFNNPNFLEMIKADIEDALHKLEEITGKIFGDAKNPLLVSVRSGESISMPGMLDTVLNVGINESILRGLAIKYDDERFALDCYRRFIQIFSDVVMGIDPDNFESILTTIKEKIGKDAKDIDMTAEHLKEVIYLYKKRYRQIIGQDFPEDPKEQLFMAIGAVFDSWDRPRAKYYRKRNNIPNIGIAISVQEMVFGNLGNQSITGVAFSRDPSTGEKNIMGEYLVNAQGEDIVAGIRTPKKILLMQKEFPDIYNELSQILQKVETHYKDAQEIEFTVEKGHLYILQTRRAKRTVQAEIKIAIDIMKEGLIGKEEALLRVDPNKLSQLLCKRISNGNEDHIIAHGIDASPGAVTGQIVFESEDAETWSQSEKQVILVKNRIKPDDIHGIMASIGILTAHGGKTSQVTLIARSVGIPAVCGAREIVIDEDKKIFTVNNRIFREGDYITIDGSSGIIIEGAVLLADPGLTPEFNELLEYADQIRTLHVRTNVDTPNQAQLALRFGCEGIGLCRTEHMFNSPERLPVVREIIMTRTREERIKTLAKIKPMQKEDFKTMFKIMEGKPVTIRLLDPPLEAFLPDITRLNIDVSLLKYRMEKGENVSKELKEKEDLLALIEGVTQGHPMLGLRGCRLGLLYPEINDMQIEAIFEAACELKSNGVDVRPEILIPFIGFVSELKAVKEGLMKLAHEIIDRYQVDLQYKFGTMIEVPRSALTADEISKEIDFFSFGTNDLTQMVTAFSRINAEHKYLPKYLEKGILKDNPFKVIDRTGTGKLIKIAVETGRQSHPGLECGISGDHSSDPESIDFFQEINMDYISCPPLKLPIARLAAAQSKIRSLKNRNSKK